MTSDLVAVIRQDLDVVEAVVVVGENDIFDEVAFDRLVAIPTVDAGKANSPRLLFS